MKTYDICIRLPVKRLALVLETLEGEGELLSIIPSPQDATKTTRRNTTTRTSRRASPGKGRPIQDQEVPKIVLAEMRKRPNDVHQYVRIAKATEEAGYNYKSASPALSHLAVAGFVTRSGQGLYQLTEKGKTP